MPRIAIVLALLIPLTSSATEPCGERIIAFNTWEDYDDQMNKEMNFSVFPPGEFTPDSAFEGLLVQREEGYTARIEIEVKEKGKIVRKKRFPVTDWSFAPAYLAMKELPVVDFIGFEPGSYVLRLVKDGKVVCENPAREIQPGD